MRHIFWVPALIGIIVPFMAQARAEGEQPLVKFQEGDRIVFLGGTLIERGQSYGFLETMITAAHPRMNLTFRNLGWSGDTVWGEARAGFGTVEEGFAHLKEHVAFVKPTVLFVNYGSNESFAGKAGLDKFRNGLERLLDVLEANKPRVIVLMSPPPQENIGKPLPDPTKHNADVKLYTDVIAGVAQKRKHLFLDLNAIVADIIAHDDVVDDVFKGFDGVKSAKLTDDGIQWHQNGYARLDTAIYMMFPELSATPAEVTITLGGPAPKVEVQGAKIIDLVAAADAISFKYQAENLMSSSVGIEFDEMGLAELAADFPILKIKGLKPGKYSISIDGHKIDEADHDDIAEEGLVVVEDHNWSDRLRKLRQVIIDKNQLYFYRWRPQNETYLFGFRKHEQGNNGREIPQFDPLVAEKEAEIAKLRVPVAHTFEIVREDDEVNQ